MLALRITVRKTILQIKYTNMKLAKLFFIFFIVFTGPVTFAQQVENSGNDSIMITIFLKHQQDKNLNTLQANQKEK